MSDEIREAWEEWVKKYPALKDDHTSVPPPFRIAQEAHAAGWIGGAKSVASEVEKKTKCPYDGTAYKEIPGYVDGYGCPVCGGLREYHCGLYAIYDFPRVSEHIDLLRQQVVEREAMLEKIRELLENCEDASAVCINIGTLVGVPL